MNHYRLLGKDRGLPKTNKPLKKRLLAEAMIRPKGIFMFEVDVHKGHSHNDTRHKLEAMARQDFLHYEIQRTKHGYHLIARINERDYKKLVHRYMKAFPFTDYNSYPRKGNFVSLRISPKVDVFTSKEISPAPKVLIDKLGHPIKGKLLVYRTSD